VLTPVAAWISLLFPLEGVPSPPSATSANWVVERFDQEEKLPPPGVRLVVENRYGDLRVRGSQLPGLRFHAVTQAAAGVAAPSLEIEKSETTWTFRISNPNERVAAPPLPRVDLAVELPEDRSLELRTQDGLLEIRGVRAFLRAQSRKGAIDLRGTGPVELVSEHGSIRWAVFPALSEGTSRLETVSGPIEVEVPTGTKATVTMQTQGHFTTDFSLQVLPLGALRKEANAVLSGGGPTIDIRSAVGDVRLLERPAARPALKGIPPGAAPGGDSSPKPTPVRKGLVPLKRLEAAPCPPESRELGPSAKDSVTGSSGDILTVVH
jgi:hypothetical protein